MNRYFYLLYLFATIILYYNKSNNIFGFCYIIEGDFNNILTQKTNKESTTTILNSEFIIKQKIIYFT